MVRTLYAIASVFVIISLTFAGNMTKGNSDNGRKLFRQTCKECHTKRGVGGEITPLTKTSAQWRAYFEKGKHSKGTLGQVMREQQLLDVQAFLVVHAADSEQPEICGK